MNMFSIHMHERKKRVEDGDESEEEKVRNM